MSEQVRMFVNGEGMSGRPLNGPLARHATFLGPVDTAPRYRFWSIRDEFPGLEPVSAGGRAVPGEVYEVDYAVLRDEFLPGEPPELELGLIELADGRGALSMVVRAVDGYTEIPPGLGWADYPKTAVQGSPRREG